MAIDDPEEIDRIAGTLRAAADRIGQEEQRVRSTMANLRFKSIDPGGRVTGDVNGAVRKLLDARTALDDTARRMKDAAQRLRNERVR